MMANRPASSEIYAEALGAFRRDFRRARKSPLIRDATVMLLATADRGGKPSVRAVSLKGFDARGFVFYTNKQSRKGRKLSKNPNAALVFLWHPIKRQVHIEGRVEAVTEEEADAYWKTRPRESQIGAWASLQSKPLRSRRLLLERFSDYARRFEGRPVPRPKVWTGFRVVPDRIEFWKEGAFRLHERTLYMRQGASHWLKRLLYP